MSVHWGFQGPGHVSRGGAFQPGASVALDFVLQEYRVGTGGWYVKDPTLLTGWSFTRASAKNALDSAGVIHSFASGVPAITDLGILIEESRTNSTWPSVATNATWGSVLNSATLTDAAGVAPDGTTTAAALLETTANDAHYALTPNGSVTIANGAAAAFSVFVKPNGRTWAFVRSNNTIGNVGCYFNLTGAGAVGTSTGSPTSCSITALANGWYRVTVVVTNSSGSSKIGNLLVATASGDGSVSYAGDVTKGLLIWGAQSELGAFSTSYIPTTSSAVTRAADNLSIANATVPGSNVTFWGKVYRPTATGAFSQIVQQGPSKPALYIASNNALTGTIPTVSDLFTAGALGAGSTKFAGAFSNGRSIGAVAGILGSANTGTWTEGSGTTLYIGETSSNGNQLNAYLSSLAIAASTYSDARVQGLTQ